MPAIRLWSEREASNPAESSSNTSDLIKTASKAEGKMASTGTEAKKESAAHESRESEERGPTSVAQPKDRPTAPCPAPTDERERPDTIPAPAWFEEVTE